MIIIVKWLLASSVALFICAEIGVAQPRPERPRIDLGITRSEVRKLLGTPKAYRQYGPGRARRDIPSAPIGEYPPSREFADLYEYSTADNTYELELQYNLDGSTSRLRPAERVTMLRWVPDKPVRTEDFLKVAVDIPEITALCRVGCAIERKAVTAGLDIAYLSPQTITEQEDAEVQWIGSFFGESPGGERKRPEASIYLERGSVSTVIRDISSPASGVRRAGIWKP